MKISKKMIVAFLCVFMLITSLLPAFAQTNMTENNAVTEPEESTAADIVESLGTMSVDDENAETVEVTAAEIPACDCIGDSLPENLALHADSCSRKQYIRKMITNQYGGIKTGAEIYKDWELYDVETRTDILNVVSAYGSTSYDELLALIAGDTESDMVFVNYDGGTTSNGIETGISAPEGAFSKNATVTVKDTTVSRSSVESLISYDVEGIVAIDISFGGMQPTTNTVVTMNIPAEKVPKSANTVYIVHFGLNGAEIVSVQHLSTYEGGKSITFGASSFSSYAAVFVSGKYYSQKMSTLLQNDSKYTIRKIKTTLFDYDPVEMNKNLLNVADNDRAFQFRGYSSNSDVTGTSGINDCTSTVSKQGIVQKKLSSSGTPTFNYVTGKNGATATGELLFDLTKPVSGRIDYRDAELEMIYDQSTGYYEYKSAANHAQYNHSNNTIELYADTLSIYNSYIATLSLGSAFGFNGYSTSSTNANGVFKGTTVSTSPNGNQRFDPYVSFVVPNEGTTADKIGRGVDNIGQIYIKAKVPAIGKNKCQVFFNSGSGYNETESMEVEYTANGNIVEFVFDTSTCAAWTNGKRITALRIDLFDSNKGSGLDNNKSYDVEIEQISLITKDYDEHSTRGGFYPFSEIEDSYPGNNTAFDLNSWKGLIADDDETTVRASRSIFNPITTSEGLRTELWFGMVVEMDFYIPVGGKVNGKDLEYIFSGDDDLWVFIDDELVLDIGGGHGAITGKLNFTKKTSWVENAITVTGYDSTAETIGSVNGVISDAVCTPGKHTFKMFYMERCGGSSNCYMKFNLPQVPKGAVTVEKDVVDEKGTELTGISDKKFTFNINAKFNESNDTTLDMSNYSYQLFDSKTGLTTAEKTDANGRFTLTATQTAVFDINENYNLTVTESSPGKANTGGYQWISTTVNGKDGLSDTLLTVKDESLTFSFVNIYTPLYGRLKVVKTGIENCDNTNGRTQSTLYHIEGYSTSGEHVSLDVVIAGNDFTVVEHIPVGTYTVTENTDWSWRYEPTISSITVTVTEDEEPALAEFKNDRTNEYYLSGDCYCENVWEESPNDAEEKKRNLKDGK